MANFIVNLVLYGFLAFVVLATLAYLFGHGKGGGIGSDRGYDGDR